jgi:lipopolysaccharide transport system ATP-binding protein
MFSDKPAIQVRGVCKSYQIYSSPRDRLKQFLLPRVQRVAGKVPKQYFSEFWALRSINFDINQGETVGIVGRNGSGKSTLLQIICGTLAPTSGSVDTNGRVAALLELGSGFNPEFTGRENVYLNAALLGLEKSEVDARYADIAAFADIGDFIDRPIKTFSSGMVVRLAFAVAIHSSPKILVIDEALSVGDELFQRKCFSHIARIKNEGATILFVSHSGSTVIDLCDRAILLDGGDQLLDGPPKAVIGLYQQLMYAPVDKASAIRERIGREGLGSLQESAEFAGESELSDASVKEVDEYFDPGLIPTSTINYESRGASIEEMRITDVAGRRVNCLVSGREYRFVFDVVFDSSATNVFFGMLIKTVTGTELGGGISSGRPQDRISYVEENARLSVCFKFRCNLNPGTYFINAGVVGVENAEEIFLHRVLDACSFRVMPIGDCYSSGVVDFFCVPEISRPGLGSTN